MDMDYYKQYEPIFGAWHITRLIGEGSYGKVFEMEREDFGVTYKAALKAITIPASQSEVRSVRSEGMDEESVRATFHSKVQELVKEFALMSRLKGNSNVVSYENHQVIEHKEGIGWDILIQMELLTPLDEYIQKKKTIPRQEIIKLGIDLCKALELCQKHNIIHRDIKPENTFISENGDFKLGDFGVARTVEKTTGGLSKQGSYPYMAPEVYNGKPYGTTVDIYSLGLILYRLLNGNRLPFLPAAPAPITYADRENALAKRFGGAPLPMPSHAEGRLGEIVLKACAFEPKDRYSSPVQMRQELEAILYNKAEGQYIYPDGDEVPQNSVHSATPGDEPPIRQEDGGTVSDFGGTVSDFDRTVSDFGKTASHFESDSTHEPKETPVRESVETDPVPEAKKRGGKRWSGIGAACLLAVCLAAVLLPKGEKKANETEPPVTAGQNEAVQTVDYLDTVTDEAGQIIREPLFQYDGSVAYAEYAYNGDGKRIQSCTYDLLGNLEERTEREYSGGKVTCSRTYDGNGVLQSYYENTLDADGNISRSDDFDAAGERIGYRIYVRDGQSSLNQVDYYTADGTLESTYIYEYDSQGRQYKYSYLDENGELNSYTLYDYDAEGNRTGDTTYSADGQTQSRIVYDSLGRQTNWISYDDDGNPSHIYEYEYDESGFRIRENQYDGGQQPEEYRTFTYGPNGKRIGESRYTAGGILIWEKEYDAAGNTLIHRSYDDSGALEGYYTYEYDSAGKRVKLNYYESDGTLTWEEEYDAAGNTLIQRSYDDNGALEGYYTYEYDGAGNRVKTNSYEGDGTLKLENEYDAAGNQVKTNYYDDGNLRAYTTYEYDSAGNQVKINDYEGDGTLSNYIVYEYDSAGNRVKTNYYEGDGILEWEYEYDAEGNQVKENYYDDDGNLRKYTTYEYDSSGNQTRENDYSADGTLTEYVLKEYNDQGQRIKTSYYDGQGVLQRYSISTYDEDGSYEDETYYNPDGTLR